MASGVLFAPKPNYSLHREKGKAKREKGGWGERIKVHRLNRHRTGASSPQISIESKGRKGREKGRGRWQGRKKWGVEFVVTMLY